MTHLKQKNYSATEPSYNQYGASTTIHFNDDSYMELEVEMRWNNQSDEIYMEEISAEYYDTDDNEIDTSSIDLEELAIEIFEHYNTFGKVEHEMEQSYRAAHA